MDLYEYRELWTQAICDGFITPVSVSLDSEEIKATFTTPTGQERTYTCAYTRDRSKPLYQRNNPDYD